MGIDPQSTVQPGVEYCVHFPTADGRISYTLTGVTLLTLPGAATGTDWYRYDLNFIVPIPYLPAGQGLKLIQSAPFVTLNSIANDNQAINAGWAVDEFSILEPEIVRNWVSMQPRLAVRDIDGYILRIGYSISLLGSYAPIKG